MVVCPTNCFRIRLTAAATSYPQCCSKKRELFPWDIPEKQEKSWPPLAGAWNYAGEEAKGGDWPPTWPLFRATTTVSVLLTFGGQDQDLRCKQRRRINSKTFRSTSATSVALFKRVAIGVNHHSLHYWLTSSQSPIKGRLALAACFLRRVGYL